MCNQGHTLTFDSQKCKIKKENSDKLVKNVVITPNNVYILDVINGEKCFMGKIDESWLWHKRMGHMNIDNMVKISTKQVIRDM
jgi:hypothetical protein